MTDPLALGEKLLSLLEESALATTYKPALLLALIDRAQEYVDYQSIPVPALAERVIELYWPQTLPYQTTEQSPQSEPDTRRPRHDRRRDRVSAKASRHDLPNASARSS